jgi:NitT/TauT family transport system substrate-binding protein
MKKLFLVIITVFFLGCENKKEINLAANEWIGYAPLFYANEMGWLKKENIRLIRTVSLGESLDLFKNGLVNAFAGTQYEYMQVKNKVVPVILLDKSYGGDVVVSNRSLNELKKASKIDVYLEMDSVNYLLLQYFAKRFGFDMKKFNLINLDQQEISKKHFGNKPVIVVTYSPYDLIYLKKGFKKLADSQVKGLLIVDAIYIDRECGPKRLYGLKAYIDRAIYEIKNNPKKVFSVIKNYYPNYDFDDFKLGLQKIRWINNPDKEVLSQLKGVNFDTGKLIYENKN